MAGADSPEEKLTGFSKYYNSVTDRGRANVAKVTLGGIALLGLYIYLKPKKKAAN
ncbi:ATP synthase F(0) complex subunit k, mitochondrial-like [Colletes latitarsis]|uniref:ATP synthase F(0) complex subunit k, mitochondrial-like n=1 Tax=Colletes latitarsis TaxID=2605962 RepID=UPI0040358F4B